MAHSSSKATGGRRLVWLWGGLALLALLVLLSLAMGARAIPLGMVIDSLAGHGVGPDAVIVREARLPRTLLGLLAGAALGLSGALIQSLTRNPLADPGILGVNAGASFAVVLGVAVFGAQGAGSLVAWASAGALAITVLVYLAGAHGLARLDPLRFLLAGVAIGAVLTGLSSGITLLNPAAFDRLRFWNAGSLDVRDLDLVLGVAPLIVAGAVLALLLARPLNALGLGQEMAVSLGIHPQRVHALAVLAITLLCGASTAAAGPIGFVGLMIPHIARWLVGVDQRWVLSFTVLLGPILLLASDIVGRLLLPGELRVSIVTAFVGAPVLIWLARRQRGTSASSGRVA